MWQKRCGSSGVAAAAGGSSGAGPAVGDQSEGRACVRAGAQTWRAHLRGYQRGRIERKARIVYIRRYISAMYSLSVQSAIDKRMYALAILLYMPRDVTDLERLL